MPIAPPPGLVRSPGLFRVNNFKQINIALAAINRDLGALFGDATSGSVSGAAVQDLAALRAVPESDRDDRQLRLVEAAPGSVGLGAVYRFDATGVGSDDGNLLIVPDVGSGRWFKNSNVEGGFFKAGVGTNASIGKGTTAPTAAGANAFSHGDLCVASGPHSFAQGTNNTASAYYSFAQGGFNTASGPYSFSQGNYNYSLARSSFTQGETNSVSGEYSFAQGGNNTLGSSADRSLVQGVSNLLNSSDCFMQGYSNFSNATSSIGSFIQGRDNSVYASSQYSFLQGYSNLISNGRSSFAQGQNNSVTTGTSLAQGLGNSIGSLGGRSFAQGQSNVIVGSAISSFAQGTSNRVDSPRGFAQGAFARAKFEDAKMWGTNRAVQGKAQTGQVGKHVQTTDATPTVVAAIPLDLASQMGMEIKVIGRGPSGNLLWTDLLDVQAHREAAGALVNGAPAFAFTRLVLTTATVSVAASGNNIEVTVTGEAATIIDWVCRVTFLESVT